MQSLHQPQHHIPTPTAETPNSTCQHDPVTKRFPLKVHASQSQKSPNEVWALPFSFELSATIPLEQHSLSIDSTVVLPAPTASFPAQSPSPETQSISNQAPNSSPFLSIITTPNHPKRQVRSH